MGREFRSKGANVQLGPGLNVARVPQCGRNFEYLSGEDPYLGATLVREVVTGIQSQAVIATAKHYVLNSQESDRGEVVSAAAERARWEIYYPPFAAAVEAGVGSVMCSYNRVDTGGGEGAQPSYACENDQTLLLDLKQGMGFKGWVMSDWGGTHSTAPAALAGLDQEMPVASFFGAPLAKAVAAGEVPAWRVDDMARRVLRAMLATGAMSWAPNATDFSANATCADHDAVARAAAAAGTVLLKNAPPGPSEVPVLPLGRGVKSIAMVGDACHEKPVVTGHGSAEVPAARLVTPLEGARAQAAARGIAVAYVSSKDPKAPLLAAAADVAVVCAGTTSGEGVDRSTLALSPAEDRLVAAVAAMQPATVAVVYSPGAVLLPWDSQVAAVLLAFLPGDQAGHSLADLLFGAVSPSGRLPLTLPHRDNEVAMTPAQFPGVNGTSSFSEGLEVGYRWYTAHNVPPKYPFGHGLSYATFTYANLTVRPLPVEWPSEGALGGAAAVVAVEVTNKGPFLGEAAEVVQLYLTYPPGAGEPARQLRGFSKVTLAPGGTRTVEFQIPLRWACTWVAGEGWWPAWGLFEVAVGASSGDTRLSALWKLELAPPHG